VGTTTKRNRDYKFVTLARGALKPGFVKVKGMTDLGDAEVEGESRLESRLYRLRQRMRRNPPPDMQRKLLLARRPASVSVRLPLPNLCPILGGTILEYHSVSAAVTEGRPWRGGWADALCAGYHV
jgi:hypothetical protein